MISFGLVDTSVPSTAASFSRSANGTVDYIFGSHGNFVRPLPLRYDHYKKSKKSLSLASGFICLSLLGLLNEVVS